MTTEPLLIRAWRMASENEQLEFLRSLAIPFPANRPVESAQMAILNLMPDELETLWDWMGETHQLPPGVN